MHNPTDGTTEYIEWNEGPTKTRQGGLVKTYRRVTQRMFATGDKNCPVNCWKFFYRKNQQD